MILADFSERLQRELLDSGTYPKHENDYNMPSANPWVDEIDIVINGELHDIRLMRIIGGRLRIELEKMGPK